ncbi:glycosyltransferase family 2 protein [Streptomyces antnestii]|uniref:glycosyltransferase family 2 protein n=1 Tax=Streptomyces antnestii TaxID=2494256 RepID=UPI001CB9C9E7|nr:glycosyltransferase family 2 protein [Streptomyces sp. San01]
MRLTEGQQPTERVSVIVIAHDDAGHVPDAVRSALAQGERVAEVIAVDDASGDGTGEVLDRIARKEPRVRVVHHTLNSGGCGTPRNTGLRLATAPWVMFLDSDDLLPPGAVDRLLAAATRHSADVVAGACVRREIPDGREVRWQPQLYETEALHEDTSAHPELLRDTVSVNKLYAREFLDRHHIRFPDGRFPYEDFVFTARVYAAAARLAVVPDPVYVWQVRRQARRLSISLARDTIGNWRSRVAAQRFAVHTLAHGGHGGLADAARVRFLEHDLRMYLRELPLRSAEYREAWWTDTRALLSGDPRMEQAVKSASAPARWAALTVLAAPHPPQDDGLRRLAALAGRPGRLLPPYALGRAGVPVWSEELPAELAGLEALTPCELPVTVDAEVTPGPRTRVDLTLHDLYGRLRAAGPESVDLELVDRATDRVGLSVRAAWTDAGEPVAGPGKDERHRHARWTARVDGLALAGLTASHPVAAWDVRARVRFRDGSVNETTVRALRPGLRRVAVPHARRLVVLLQPYATHDGSLAFRVAPGVRGALRIAGARAGRVLRDRLPARPDTAPSAPATPAPPVRPAGDPT